MKFTDLSNGVNYQERRTYIFRRRRNCMAPDEKLEANIKEIIEKAFCWRLEYVIETTSIRRSMKPISSQLNNHKAGTIHWQLLGSEE